MIPRSPFSPTRSARYLNQSMAMHDAQLALTASNALGSYRAFVAARLAWEYEYPEVPRSTLLRRIPVYGDTLPALAYQCAPRALRFRTRDV